MRPTIAGVLCVMAWLTAGLAVAAMDDVLDATCRITTADGGRGTGCVFEISGGRVHVLTAAHVVGRDAAVQCEFWREGHVSHPLRAAVVARVESVDAALLAIDQRAFAGVLPKAIPIAPRDCVLTPGAALTSAGCAAGSWSTAWKGHVLGYAGDDLRFVPAPANGRSGSAVLDAEGRMIVGLLRARTMDDGEGIASSVQSLYRAFGRPTRAEDVPPLVPVQCAGGVCSPWGARPQQPAQPASPWTSPLPSSSSVELGPTNERLDRIAELLRALHGEPAPATVDETARQAAEAAQQETSRLREAVGALVGDPTTLLQRAQARRDRVQQDLGDEASTLDVARAYAHDAAREKLSDGSAGLTIGKIITGALGLSGPLALGISGGLWLVARRLGRKL